MAQLSTLGEEISSRPCGMFLYGNETLSNNSCWILTHTPAILSPAPFPLYPTLQIPSNLASQTFRTDAGLLRLRFCWTLLTFLMAGKCFQAESQEGHRGHIEVFLLLRMLCLVQWEEVVALYNVHNFYNYLSWEVGTALASLSLLKVQNPTILPKLLLVRQVEGGQEGRRIEPAKSQWRGF